MPVPAVKVAANGIPALEAQLSHATNIIYETILDLNIPNAKLVASIDEAMVVRAKILALYGVPQPAPTPTGRGGFKAPDLAAFQQAGAAGQEADGNWKGKLNTAVCKSTGRVLQKGDLTYTVHGEANSSGFLATVTAGTSGVLTADYSTDEPQISKKAAEQAVAKIALMAEFPGAVSADGQVVVQGVKRKAAAVAGDGAAALINADAKSRLSRALQILFARPVQKTDVVYLDSGPQGEGATPGSFISRVSLPAHDPNATFEGQAADSKKGAENNAAEAALTALQHLVEAADEERKAKKAAKAAKAQEAREAREKKTSSEGNVPGLN